MDESAAYDQLSLQARERTLSAYENLARASAELSSLALSQLELDVLKGLFVVDGFTDDASDNPDISCLLQAIRLWPDRTMDDWEKRFASLSADPIFQHYRLMRDIAVSRSRLSAAAVRP